MQIDAISIVYFFWDQLGESLGSDKNLLRCPNAVSRNRKFAQRLLKINISIISFPAETLEMLAMMQLMSGTTPCTCWPSECVRRPTWWMPRWRFHRLEEMHQGEGCNAYMMFTCTKHRKKIVEDQWIFRYLQISDFSFGQATIHESLGFKLDLQVPLQTATAKSATLLDKARKAMLIQCGQRNSALNSAPFWFVQQKLYIRKHKETMYIFFAPAMG